MASIVECLSISHSIIGARYIHVYFCKVIKYVCSLEFSVTCGVSPQCGHRNGAYKSLVFRRKTEIESRWAT